jgi:uncharacterized protein YbjT (DUF2867 family)
MTSYVVTGITGQVGGAVARALLASGLPVRAVVRDEAKGRVWRDLGCEVAVADYARPQELAHAFHEATGVFAMLPSNFDPTPGFPEARALIATLRDALGDAAPDRVVALSTIGAEASQPNLLSQLGLMERALSDLATPVTFLRAAWFMENAAWDIAPARDEGVFRSFLQPLDRPFPMISAEDVGRTAAGLLTETWEGVRVVNLEAAQRVTPNAIAAALAAAVGRPVRAETIAPADWEMLFRAQGMANPDPRIQMLEGFNAGWIDFPEQGAGARKGAITIDQAIAALVRKAG